MSDQLLDRVWSAIDPERVRRLLLEMVEIYSPSGKEEDVQLYLEEVLAGAGFAVERQPVEEARYNLHLVMGEGEPQLYLVGHVDTVAAWDLEEYGPREEWGVVRGLGTADMKGGCAAMVEAWLALASLPPEERPPVGLLLVVGEEENGDGSAEFLQTRRPPWVVIGEPTSLAPCFSHYGYLEAALTTQGRRIHSSLPELGHNAVESMLRVLLHLGKDPLFDRQSSDIVYSIREMSSSRAGFVVPDRCEALIDLHLPPETDPAQVQQAMRERLANAGQFVEGLNLEVSFDFASRGYQIGGDNRLGQVLEAIYPRLNLPLRFDAFRSHSDGNLFFEAGVPCLILGPGSLETAHTPDEQTSLPEVEAAARIYAALCLGSRAG
ncbi:acetylornithine deacetylase [Desulfuromonas versatilis]|uniref:Acetylornithine deacetylase n=1 Tax=Desulfuromonas versatilis TaxID=2802975 RepID=A0ABN6E3B1_9BACT|nr:M20/M25/M40 family metallo-hydrolase [Desulfuromonas versatilis]BCR06846.1 acetylornithine deacetylase [Desulfuromonas versatilis]